MPHSLRAIRCPTMRQRTRWLIFAAACIVVDVCGAALEPGRNNTTRMSFLLLAGVPLTAVAAWTLKGWFAQRRKPLSGVCRKCGYNLTGNVSGVCPECGEAVAKKTA
jgi:hypothetical protein